MGYVMLDKEGNVCGKWSSGNLLKIDKGKIDVTNVVCDECLKVIKCGEAILNSSGCDEYCSIYCRDCFDKHICNRINSIQNVNEYWFCGDLPNGKMLVQCQMCGCEFETKSKLSKYREECPICKEILDYPDGASW